MANVEQPTNCHLFRLPPELREQIYAYIFNHDVQCSLAIEDDSKINQRQPSATGRPGAATALLRTCRLIYSETVATFYKSTVFRVFIYGEPRTCKTRFEAPLEPSHPLLKRVRHLRLVVWLWSEPEVDVAFRRLKAFADCLEEAGAELGPLFVNVSVWRRSSDGVPLTPELVKQRCDELLHGICKDSSPDTTQRGQVLFRILKQAHIGMGIHGPISRKRPRDVLTVG